MTRSWSASIWKALPVIASSTTRSTSAWRHYRFAVAYLMFLPVVILIGWDGLEERSRALCVKLTERAVATIDDIDALEVFE